MAISVTRDGPASQVMTADAEEAWRFAKTDRIEAAGIKPGAVHAGQAASKIGYGGDDGGPGLFRRVFVRAAFDDTGAIETPRRAMGELLGNAVRFGTARDVLAASEGIETMLSLRCVLPTLPMVAALSAAHLAAILFPLTLRRLYIARDADAAGDMALAALTERAKAAGIEALALSLRLGDFNEDLRRLGIDELRAYLPNKLVPNDVVRFSR